MSTVLRLTAAAVLFLGLAGLSGCGSGEPSGPQQLSDQEKQQKMEEYKRLMQEKMGGGAPGMKPEDMAKMKEKYATPPK